MAGVESGMEGSAQMEVGDGDTAIALGSGDVPVLATPRLVALCEEATLAAVAGRLAPGQTTVGSRVELDHLRPTAPGAAVVARARVTGVRGRRITFEVAAADDSGDVARGTVVRAIVDRARFAGSLSESA